MESPQEETQKNEVLQTARRAAAQPPASSFAKSWGEWAHAHRDTFDSPKGKLVFRNILKVLVGVIPTAFTFTGTRYAFKAYNDAAHLNSGIHRPLKALTKIPLVQQSTFIFGGFTVFRAFCKLWQRNYDRIFAKSDDASKAIGAIDNLPANMAGDLKEILPAEITGTAIAALPLAAIKTGFKHAEGPLQGNLAQAGKGFVNDWLASVPAYTVFFETNDRLYDQFTKSKDSEDHYRELRGLPEPSQKTPKKYGFFTEDGLPRIAMRRVGSLLLGVAPFIGLQRYSRAAIGEVKPGVNSFLNNVMKEYGGYAGFATYTTIAELYGNAYDKLFERLEAKEQKKSDSRQA